MMKKSMKMLHLFGLQSIQPRKNFDKPPVWNPRNLNHRGWRLSSSHQRWGPKIARNHDKSHSSLGECYEIDGDIYEIYLS